MADLDAYALLPIRPQDVEPIRIWRNSQIEVLRQKTPLSFDEQQTYFEKEVWPFLATARPPQILFSFLYRGECIGYGGLTHLDWEAKKAELSFLVQPERADASETYRQDFLAFLTLLCKAAFDSIQLHRIWAETFAYRTLHSSVLEEFGFKREGILRDHIFKKGRWWDSYLHGLIHEK